MRNFLYGFIIAGKEYPDILVIGFFIILLITYGILFISYFFLLYQIFFNVNFKVFLLSPINKNLANNFLSGKLKSSSFFKYINSFIFWIVYYFINLLAFYFLFEIPLINEIFNNNLLLEFFLNIGLFITALDRYIFLIIMIYLSIGVWNTTKNILVDGKIFLFYSIRLGIIIIWFYLLNLNNLLKIF